jgi:hypothetical protein
MKKKNQFNLKRILLISIFFISLFCVFSLSIEARLSSRISRLSNGYYKVCENEQCVTKKCSLAVFNSITGQIVGYSCLQNEVNKCDSNTDCRACSEIECAIHYNSDIAWSDLCDYGEACCDNPTDCVDFNSHCYGVGDAYLISSSSDDAFAFCVSNNQWFECDSGSSACQSCSLANGWDSGCSGLDCYVGSGELYVGEYSDLGLDGCCGDDINEYYIVGGDGTEACCNSPDKIVENGLCKVNVGEDEGNLYVYGYGLLVKSIGSLSCVGAGVSCEDILPLPKDESNFCDSIPGCEWKGTYCSGTVQSDSIDFKSTFLIHR